MKIRYTDDPDRPHIGWDFTPAEARALGPDLHLLTDQFDTMLSALVALRTGHRGGDPNAAPYGPAECSTAIGDQEKLRDALDALRMALVRQYRDSGGKVVELRWAFNESATGSHSTAQYWWDKTRKLPPTPGEQWATTAPADPR